jgi:hypothetical protein
MGNRKRTRPGPKLERWLMTEGEEGTETWAPGAQVGHVAVGHVQVICAQRAGWPSI